MPTAEFETANKVKVATWSDLEDRQPAPALVANVDLVIIRYDQQVSVLYMGVNGHLDEVPVEKILDLEKAYHEFMASNHADILQTIMDTGDLDDDTDAKLKSAVEEFLGSVAY
jgi:F0F1-type ATP synthase alpha subunit